MLQLTYERFEGFSFQLFQPQSIPTSPRVQSLYPLSTALTVFDSRPPWNPIYNLSMMCAAWALEKAVVPGRIANPLKRKFWLERWQDVLTHVHIHTFVITVYGGHFSAGTSSLTLFGKDRGPGTQTKCIKQNPTVVYMTRPYPTKTITWNEIWRGCTPLIL